MAALPDVTAVTSPYAPAGAAQMNADHSVAFATLTYSKSADSVSDAAGKALVSQARSFRSAQLDVAVGGDIAGKAASPSLGGVGFGIGAAAIVLFLVFGSLLAASLPLISTLLALFAATSVLDVLSHALQMPDFTTQLVMLIGLGVGVDYALFIVTRFRQALQKGQNVESAVVTAVVTSGRAVLFAGAIVCIALLGMIALGVSVLSGLGIGAAVGVAFTMATSLTLLPALLGFFGPRVLSRRQRRHLTQLDLPAETGAWWRWSALLARRPAAPAAIAVGILVILAMPFLSLRLGSSDSGNDPSGTSTRQAYDLLAKGFGAGVNGPLQVAAQVSGPNQAQALSRVTAAVARDHDVATVTPTLVLAHHGTTQTVAFDIYPRTSPQDAATGSLVSRLRHQVIPQADAGSGLHIYVGGKTATDVDFSHVLGSKLPLFIGLVVLLSLLLLTVVFRSILIPLTAAVMNLLSAGAGLGALSAVYGWAWGGNLLGATRAGPIDAFLPVMVFAILFGLSMDYQVFLVSRMQEEFQRTGDNKLAVSRGLALTGRTITAAAIIMIVVFGSFILGSDRVIKEFGFGLAAAVAIDAFLIRMAVVPGLMHLFGQRNWWLPRRLAAVLPRVSLDEDEPNSQPTHPIPEPVSS
jgi:RND superfamily putative drug exporter